MPILLSDEEIDAMEGLPHLHRCLYIFGIRKHMDYQTGITGIKRKISYKSLSEEVYVVPHQGMVDTGAKSREAIRRAVKALEKAGLITIKSSEKNLILECNLARRDKSVQNKPDTNPTPQPDTKADTVNKAENHYKNRLDHLGALDKPDTQANIPEKQKPDTHPVSGINTNLTNYVRDNSKSYPQALKQTFYDALKDRKFGMDGMIDPRTGAMLTVWESKGVTIEDLKVGMDFADVKNEGTPRYPMFYKSFVLSAMKARLEANEEINKPEVNHERRQAAYQPKESSVQRVRRRLAELAEADGYDPNNLPD